MPRVKANGIEIEYEEFGASQDPLIVLIAGFGEQMGGVEFQSDFCQGLSSKGLRVVRFDNRDVGLSTHFTASVSESGVAPYTVVGRDGGGYIPSGEAAGQSETLLAALALKYRLPMLSRSSVTIGSRARPRDQASEEPTVPAGHHEGLGAPGSLDVGPI